MIEAVKERREKAGKTVTHMGEYTRKKSKQIPVSKTTTPKANRSKQKMTKSAKKKGRRGFGF